MRRPCDRCAGTDLASYCAAGQCYAEEEQRQNRAEADHWEQRWQEENHEVND